jgi:hypothetical protein
MNFKNVNMAACAEKTECLESGKQMLLLLIFAKLTIGCGLKKIGDSNFLPNRPALYLLTGQPQQRTSLAESLT